MPNTPIPAAGEAMPAVQILTRRTLLGGIASVPALAGATAALAVEQSTTAESPLDRARRHWAAFSAAMDELSSDAHGWCLIGAGNRKPYEHLLGGKWSHARLIEYEHDDSLCAGHVVERHREVTL